MFCPLYSQRPLIHFGRVYYQLGHRTLQGCRLAKPVVFCRVVKDTSTHRHNDSTCLRLVGNGTRIKLAAKKKKTHQGTDQMCCQFLYFFSWQISFWFRFLLAINMFYHPLLYFFKFKLEVYDNFVSFACLPSSQEGFHVLSTG